MSHPSALLLTLSGGDSPELNRPWTQTEELYFLYKVSKDPAVKKDCRGRLAAICIKAVGNLTPPWRGKWNPEFDSLRYKSRAPWVYRWVDDQLKLPQSDLCRYIGRRCKNALADEIRAATRKHRVRPEPAAPPDPSKILEQQQELMATLGLHLRYSDLTRDERLLAFDSVMALKPRRNVDVAKEWGCSEGQVRKVRASLLTKLKQGKARRKRHFEENESRQRRAAHQAKLKAGKRGVKDRVWWDKKRDGNPL
jgi:hypothetical protein